MIHLSLLLVGFLLGIFSVCALAALYLLHRPLYVAPTKYRRKPVPEVMPAVEREEGGVDYRFINLTGLEE